MSEKESGGDFRYAVGESKVPWHAVGEFYDGSDAVEMVKFLLPHFHQTADLILGKGK